MLITLIYASVADLPAAQGALRGMGAVAAGLIGATGIKLVSALKGNPMGHPACALLGLATFVLIALLRVPLVLVLPGIGVAGCVLAYRRLAPDKPATEPGK